MFVIIPIIVFLGTAYGGYVLSTQIKKETGILSPILDFHRYSALVGIIILALIIGFTESTKLVIAAFIIILSAFIGGIFLFRLVFKNQAPPMLVVYGHAGIAIMGIVLLMTTVLI